MIRAYRVQYQRTPDGRFSSSRTGGPQARKPRRYVTLVQRFTTISEAEAWLAQQSDRADAGVFLQYQPADVLRTSA